MKYLINMKINKLFLKSKKKRKKGFTLIELVAVLAIIAILSAAFVPKFSNYITEAKKVTVLNEAKSVVTAYESVSYKINTNESSTTIESLQAHFPDISANKIPPTTTIETCKKILESNNNFTLDSSGIFEGLSSNSDDTTTD